MTLEILGESDATAHLAFGLRQDAAVGVDDFDVPAPPIAPGNLLYAYFRVAESGTSLPNRWTQDIRPVLELVEKRLVLWELVVEPGVDADSAELIITLVETPSYEFKLEILGDGISVEAIDYPFRIRFRDLTASQTFFLVMTTDGAVDSDGTTLGGVKSLFHYGQ